MSSETDIWDHNIDCIIKQPFTYADRGRQCFAFVSQDGEYILKIPRTDVYQVPFWLRTLPLGSLREKVSIQKEANKRFVFNSFQIGYENLKELTGILFLHLKKTAPTNQTLTLIDSLGYKYRVKAHEIAFILQKKQSLLIPAFLDALAQGNRSEGERILTSLAEAMIARGQKGIGNKDSAFLKNYGFNGRDGFLIDIGSFYYNKDTSRSIYDSIQPVRKWLETIDAEMLVQLDLFLEKNGIIHQQW